MWNLDEKTMPKEGIDYLKTECILTEFEGIKVGDKIAFMTGANRDISAVATVKGIDETGGLYVYNDAYWMPIYTSNKDRKIQKL